MVGWTSIGCGWERAVDLYMDLGRLDHERVFSFAIGENYWVIAGYRELFYDAGPMDRFRVWEPNSFKRESSCELIVIDYTTKLNHQSNVCI